MKLGVSYIVFDGIELLEKSIIQIREHVDFITVIYQKKSWFGDSINPIDLKILNSLKTKGLINQLIEFTNFSPLSNKSPQNINKSKRFETLKRQFGLSQCLIHQCTHYLCMDVDEFYVSSEFKKAKQIIKSNNYTATSVRFINYVNIPLLHRGIDPNHVPFICKISNTSRMASSFFVKCDPTRGIINGFKNNHSFNPSIIKMHHMETVRKDLYKKYNSTTRKIFKRNRINELVNQIKDANQKNKTLNFKKIICPASNTIKLTECQNIFNIDFEKWQ